MEINHQQSQNIFHTFNINNNKKNSIVTFGLQRERLRLEKQPSHTMVRGALAVSSCPLLVLKFTPLMILSSSSRNVTVPCSNFTLHKIWNNKSK